MAWCVAENQTQLVKHPPIHDDRNQSCQVVIRNESEILNVGMSKPPKVASRPAGVLGGAVSPPAGYVAEPRSQKFVSKMKKKYYLKLKDMFFR